MACGNLNNGKLAFYELLSPFSLTSWLVIFSVLILVLPFVILKLSELTRKLNNGKGDINIWQIYNFIFGILVEQSVYFDSRICKIKQIKLRILLGVVFIMCLILSAAYKRENLTNIVSPIKATPIKTFDQLVENQYEIYVKPFKHTSYQLASGLKALPNTNHCIHHTEENGITFVLVSELLDIVSEVQSNLENR